MFGKNEINILNDIANTELPKENGMCGECVNFPRNTNVGASNMICPNGGIVCETTICSCPYFSKLINS